MKTIIAIFVAVLLSACEKQKPEMRCKIYRDITPYADLASGLHTGPMEIFIEADLAFATHCAQLFEHIKSNTDFWGANRLGTWKHLDRD